MIAFETFRWHVPILADPMLAFGVTFALFSLLIAFLKYIRRIML